MSPEAARELFPLLDLDGVLGAAYISTDGHVNRPRRQPGLCERRARFRGAEVLRHTAVTGIERDGRAWRVRTAKGDIRAEIVGVNAAGQWARSISDLVGVDLPKATRVGRGCVIETGARVTDCRIEDGVTVRAYSVLSASRVRAGAAVGPFAHVHKGTTLGPGADLGNSSRRLGSTIGAGTLAKHLTYLGDATVGANVNVGAGPITCN